MKNKIIKIKLTDDQLDELQPLFDKAKKHPMEGMIIGQLGYKAGYVNGDTLVYFKWMKPDEIISRAHKAIEQANDKTIKPA